MCRINPCGLCIVCCVVGLLVLFNWSARSPPQPEAAISLKQLLAIAIDVAARGGVEVVRYVSCLSQPEAAISLKQLLAIAIDVAARRGVEVVRYGMFLATPSQRQPSVSSNC
jgi:hypothetical protein